MTGLLIALVVAARVLGRALDGGLLLLLLVVITGQDGEVFRVAQRREQREAAVLSRERRAPLHIQLHAPVVVGVRALRWHTWPEPCADGHGAAAGHAARLKKHDAALGHQQVEVLGAVVLADERVAVRGERRAVG